MKREFTIPGYLKISTDFNLKIFLTIACILLLIVNSDAQERMKIGTNFWFLAPAWSGENPWKWTAATDGNSDYNAYVPDDPYTNKINPWNPAFLEETAFYSCLRFMDWQKTNSSFITSWSQRRLPDDKANFGPNTIATTSGKPNEPGLAFEWMVDLCNVQQADIWICIPHGADDGFIQNLAALIKEKLNPGLQVYVEYSNEIWNFQDAQNHCKNMAVTIGLNADFEGAMKYQAYRSAQIWKIFEDEFGEEKSRVINVIATQSSNSSHGDHLLLPSLFNDNFNPTKVLPEAYAIAPYFGGNGLDGNDSQIWSKLRTDIFEHRHDKPTTDSRLQDVKQHYALAQAYDLKLIAYEGGQHLSKNALQPNRDLRMYGMYIDYLDAIAPYIDLFCHYTHTGSFSNGGCWGAKEYTGQPLSEAHKYRALVDWAKDEVVTSIEPDDFGMNIQQIPFYPNPVSGASFLVRLDYPAAVSLQDTTGKTLFNLPEVKSDLEIPTHDLENGLYILTIREGIKSKNLKILISK